MDGKGEVLLLLAAEHPGIILLMLGRVVRKDPERKRFAKKNAIWLKKW